MMLRPESTFFLKNRQIQSGKNLAGVIWRREDSAGEKRHGETQHFWNSSRRDEDVRGVERFLVRSWWL